MSAIHAKIDTLLGHNMRVDEIATIVERPIEEITLYVANKGMPEGLSLSLPQIQKVEVLFARNVPAIDVSSVLSLDARVIAIYQTNRRHLASGNNEQQRANQPQELATPMDFLRWVYGFGEHMKPFVEESTYQGLTPEKWKEYKAATLKLHWAIDQGFLHLLSENKGQIHTKNAEAYSPIQWASLKGCAPAIKPLLDLGAYKEEEHKDGNTPIFLATQGDHGEVIEKLAKFGVNVNRRNHAKLTPLQVAVNQSNVNATRALLENGADPNVTYPLNLTVLMVACQNGNEEIIKLLAARANGGIRELRSAVITGLGPTKALFEVAHAKYAPLASNILLDLFFYGKMERPEVLEFLIEQGANPSATHEIAPKLRQPVIVQAVTRNQCQYVRILLKHGAICSMTHPSIPKSPYNQNLIHSAVWRGFDEMVEILCEHGADYPSEYQSSERTYVNLVVGKCGERALRALHKRGLDINKKTDKGVSVIGSAPNHLVPVLAELGFDPAEGKKFLAKLHSSLAQQEAQAERTGTRGTNWLDRVNSQKERIAVFEKAFP